MQYYLSHVYISYQSQDIDRQVLWPRVTLIDLNLGHWSRNTPALVRIPWAN